MRRILTVGLLIQTWFLLSCASQPVADSPVESMPPNEYSALIRKYTRGTDQYQGFHQTFQADVTMLNTEVTAANVRKRAQFLGWDEGKYQEERERALQETNAYSKFFLRFFTPERDYDDLAKGKTIWKIYLDLDGRRFEGKARKSNVKLVETVALFPHMDRFSTAYEITFNVPMTTLERQSSHLIITSSLGSAEFQF